MHTYSYPDYPKDESLIVVNSHTTVVQSVERPWKVVCFTSDRSIAISLNTSVNDEFTSVHAENIIVTH